MTRTISIRRSLMIGALIAGATIAGIGAVPDAALAQQATRPASNPSNDLLLSVGRGRLITLPVPMTDVFVANQAVADVQVRSSTQLYVFGKAPGETSIYATDARGRVVYSTVTRVGNNIETIDQMLALAMPDANITVNTMNGFVLLTGTVAAPEDAAEADRLVTAFVGEGTRVLSRIQTATPLQVNLQVRIAEVSRSVLREMGGNLTSRDSTSGLLFGAFRGRSGAGTISTDTTTGATTYRISQLADAATIGVGGRLAGLNLLATLDLAETTGMVATLAQPNLTTISGETADFLAGGEYPVPIPDPVTGGISIQYKKFGVSLAYTPTVLSNGRISLRVRPEVSELSTEGAITISGIQVPALSVRRAETTVELGSGESFMIAGLMSNRSVGSLARTPGLGDIPILGSLFKSDSFRRGDTELVIVVTPYLVRPVSADQIALPTDGFRSPTDAQRILTNGVADGESGTTRPMPTLENAPANVPSQPGAASLPVAVPAQSSAAGRRSDRNGNSAAPGFSFGQ
jgi:pilus assembly protein CpaC